MEWTFEIMYIHRHHNRGDFIFARLTEGQVDFEVKEGSALDGIPIYHYVEMPRKLDENGKPRLDICIQAFKFRMASTWLLPGGSESQIGFTGLIPSYCKPALLMAVCMVATKGQSVLPPQAFMVAGAGGDTISHACCSF
jgi:hypothetical protein